MLVSGISFAQGSTVTYHEPGFGGLTLITDLSRAVVAFKQAFLDGSQAALYMFELADVCGSHSPAPTMRKVTEMMLKVKKIFPVLGIFHGSAQIITVHQQHVI